MLNQYFIALLTTSVTHAALSCFVYLRGRDRLTNITYALYSAAIAVWSGGEAFAITSDSYANALFLWRLNHVGVVFIPIFFVHFVMSLYSKTDYAKHRTVIFLSYLAGITFLFLNLSGILIRDVEQKFDFHYFINSTGMYPFFFSLWVAWAIYGLICLFRLYLVSPSNKRNQLSYFSISMCIAYMGGIPNFLPTFNIVIPVVMPFGTYAVSLYAFFTVYAIVAYRLMDIEVIIRRTVVFAGLLGMVMLTMTAVMALAQGVASRYVSVPPMVVTAITALIAIALFDRTRQILIDLTDQFLFQKKFDYRQLLKDASRGVALIQSLDRLAKLIVAFMTMRARIKNAALFIHSDEGFTLETVRGVTYGENLKKISQGHPLVKKLVLLKQPLRRSEFVPEEGITDYDSEAIYSLLSELNSEAIIPSFLGRGAEEGTNARDRLSLRGFLVLGPKKSDEEYTQDDLDVFSTLAQESAIAIENARLYDAQIQKTTELAKANEDLAFTNKKLNDATSDLMKALSETEKAKKELESTQAQMLDMKRRELVARMSAAMGHEIQNPLQGISFTYYHFGKLGKILDEILEYGKEIGDAKIIELTDRTISIVNQDIAQPLRNHTDRIKGIANSVTDLIKGQDRFADIHLGLIINYAIEEIRFTTYWERLAEPTIEINLPRNLPLVHANSHRLQGVFVNLIKNAYDAMKGKAEKRITIRGEDDPENPALIRIYFEDSGCGMDEETAKHSFDFKFTTKGDHGTGIGLAYCKDTIEAHGGTISVKTEPGKGATFIFTLKKGKPYGVGGDKYEKNVGHRR